MTKQRDLIGIFSLGLNHGYDEKDFFWSDMLHYRSTGKFGQTLWQNADAKNDDSLRAYAFGYITHLATDVTGHPFVNAVAGGPFREQWGRHHTVENHADAFWYLGDDASGAPRTIPGYVQYTESALYFDIAFNDDGSLKLRPSFPTGHSLRENWERTRLLDTDSKLPDAIADLLTQTMHDVFYQEGTAHPEILGNDGLPTREQVQEAYDLLFRFLKLTTVDGFNHERPSPPEVWNNLDFPTPTDPTADSSPSDDDDSFWGDLLSFCLAIISAILYIAEVALWIVTLPIAVVADLATYPIRYLLYYALELPLFEMLKDFRAVLVLSGYLSPMDDEITTSFMRVGMTRAESYDQVKSEMGDVFGGVLDKATVEGTDHFQDPAYPHFNKWMPDRSENPEYKHTWEYPKTAAELALTTCSPYAKGADPSVLFRGTLTDPGLRDNCAAAQGPEDTESWRGQLTPTRNLGDAVNLSQYFLWLMTRNADSVPSEVVADYNLDGDRGYAYKCWDWNRVQGANPPTSQDADGRSFVNPCVWPSQAKDDGQPFDILNTLKIHYVPGDDPGCGDYVPVPVK